MQFKLLSQNRVQTQPTYIHTLDNKSFIVSYTDKTFEAYTEAKRYSLKQNFPSALCGQNISEDTCLLGLENGNGLLVRIRNDQADFNLQEWREKQYNLTFSVAIIFIGKINQQQYIAVHEDGTLLILQQSNDVQFTKITKLKYNINIGQAYFNQEIGIITSANLIFTLAANQISKYTHWELDKFRQLSASQLKLFGQTIHQYNDYWKQQCQINGTIYKMLYHKTIIYLITEKGYFYTLIHKMNSIEIEKIIDFNYSKPLQLNLINDDYLHISFQGSQLLLYNLKNKVVSTLLSIKSDKQLIGSRIERKDSNFLILVIYRNKPSNFLELYPPKLCDAHVKLISSINNVE
ncbi:unnamed protein product [Paramecium pentaurelia]|uniref:Uncharacterized protein n=1 Tax=Paramecium pentaurelia TaxID=43138 RepID=A0A8S1XZQ8_9CILI|nr:unnamed protein product [Paramecium pentaurelia]